MFWRLNLWHISIWTFSFSLLVWGWVNFQTCLIFQYDHFEYQQPYVIFKIECFVLWLCSKWSELKKASRTRVIFSRQLCWVPSTLYYLQNWMFCSITPFQVVRFQKFLHKQWSFFSGQSFWVSTTLCYLQNCSFCPIFPSISILFALCLHKPYFFLLFKCNFDSLEWEFWTYCSYVDLESSSKIKLICVPTHHYWSIPFSVVNSIFFKLFYVYARYM